MAVVNFPDKLISFEPRRRVGPASYFGEQRYGEGCYGQDYIEMSPYQYGKRLYADAEYGENFSVDGIYQMRPRAKGRIAVRMKFYMPSETAARIANPRRLIFANAVLAWQGLTTLQKEFYRLKSKNKRMSGYNVFLHEYLISH
jgi:hypothetical protein